MKQNRRELLASAAMGASVPVLSSPSVVLEEPGVHKEMSPKVTDIYVVVKSHFDLGFTDQAENVFRRYRGEMVDSALAVFDANRELPHEERFVWTVPSWPLAVQMLGTNQEPASFMLDISRNFGVKKEGKKRK